ncbi:shikimate kinase AroL [Acerihabitans sp. KWT182]|uniref:Shikimate kinase 1 n=1 Tax=Acerihabitans sp. KWT182 TaxID=3157919 RepID=A0AAU7QFI0_9GAMM
MIQPIFMVGARGCGKTTVGRALARALGFAFADTDLELLRSTGLSVAQIVEQEGWAGFRIRESEILHGMASAGGNQVIATGGGIVLSESNRRYMRASGTVFYLYAPAEVLASRLEAVPEEDQRPSLTGRPIAEEIKEILLARETLYQDAAHHVLDASLAPEDVVSAIMQRLCPLRRRLRKSILIVFCAP